MIFKIIELAATAILGHKVDQWLTDKKQRSAFRDALKETLKDLAKQGYDTGGHGSVDHSFIINESVNDELWRKLLDPGITEPVDFDRLWKDLEDTYRDFTIGDNEKEAIMFFVQRLEDRMWSQQPLQQLLSAKVSRRLDLFLKMIFERMGMRQQIEIRNPAELPLDVRGYIDSEAFKPYEIPGVTLHNLPFPQNPLFTGREDLLKDLHESLSKSGSTALSQPQAISGLGGIGKTQIAVEYAYQHIKDYKFIIWVNSESETTITSSYSEIARLLNLPEKDDKELGVVVAAVKTWLETHNEWLLIYDNADKPEIIKEYQPRSGQGQTLLTSRASAFGNLAKALEVTEMAEDEAIDFLLKRANIEEPTDDQHRTAKDISNELGLLPLAVDQAGAFVEKTRCSLDDYLNDLKEKGIEVLKDKRYSPDDYDHTVATTWSMSLETLQQKSKVAIDVLSLAAYFAPDAIPLGLFRKRVDSFDDNLKSVAYDTFELDKALGALQSYSLIRRKRDTDEFSLHRLLQAVIRDNHTESGDARKWAELAIVCTSETLPDERDYRTWSECETILPHILSLVQHTDSLEISNETVAQLFSRTGYYLHDRADYGQAELLYKRALKIDENIYGSDHLKVAADLESLAILYETQGRYDDAEPLYERAYEIREKAIEVLKDEHYSLVLRGRHNMAHLGYTITVVKGEPRRYLVLARKSDFGKDDPQDMIRWIYDFRQVNGDSSFRVLVTSLLIKTHFDEQKNQMHYETIRFALRMISEEPGATEFTFKTDDYESPPHIPISKGRTLRSLILKFILDINSEMPEQPISIFDLCHNFPNEQEEMSNWLRNLNRAGLLERVPSNTNIKYVMINGLSGAQSFRIDPSRYAEIKAELARVEHEEAVPKVKVGTVGGKKFDVALSFAGEQRNYVRQVKKTLDEEGDINVFYDEDYEVELWGKDLANEFSRIYGKESERVVIFISKDYVEKGWTNHEFKSALSKVIAQKAEGYILPMRFDNSELEGLSSLVGYIDISGLKPEECARKIIVKVKGSAAVKN